jgi:glycosyltransferase involved in cell wall biosynthesis
MTISVAFVFDCPKYKGGFYYVMTLLQALLTSSNKSLIVLVGHDFALEDVPISVRSSRVKIIRSKSLTQHSVRNLIYRMFRACGFPLIFLYWALKHRIDVFSHSEAPSSLGFFYKSYNWIPDVQFVDLPHNFSLFSRIRYWQRFFSFIAASDKLIFSSQDTLTRCIKLYPFFKKQITRKSFILRFCTSNLSSLYYDPSEIDSIISQGFSPDRPYLFLPNQFWQHKNHIVFLRAFRKVRHSYPTMQLLLTGSNQDFRNPKYALDLSLSLASREFGHNIFYGGLVSRGLFSYLLKTCTALVNPSLYEGWSTTVEEALSVNKYLLISNLPVNIEQTKGYSRVSYFDPESISSISSSLLEFYSHVDVPTQDSYSTQFYEMRYSLFKEYVNSLYQ